MDNSGEAIARASAFATRCGLGNVSLQRASVTDVEAVRGEFDYILCHGVYSWVTEPAREAILGLCARHLSPRGLALVSYNAMPGGFARQAVREMLRWHVRSLASPAEQIEEALALARFLSEHLGARDACAQALQAELRAAQEKPGGTFFHDDLADVNRAFFLHEFVADAARQGLRYVADADLTDLAHTALPPEARTILDALTDDRLEREQYLDLLTVRRFLLEAAAARIVQCHAFAPRTVVAAGVRPLAFAPARVLAAESALIVNAFHQMVRLEERSSRELLRRLDGSRTREELLAELHVLAASAPPSLSDPLPSSGPVLDARLAQLGRHGFLVA